jgi:hypothetical protein
MARLTTKVPGADPNTYGHRFATLGELATATPAVALFVMPDSTVGVWINPEVAAKVDTEDCDRMVACIRKVLLACVRPQG